MANGMKGSGLGLAIANSLIELHGGALRITSKPGEGTAVLVSLPRVARAARARWRSRPSPEATPRRRRFSASLSRTIFASST